MSHTLGQFEIPRKDELENLKKIYSDVLKGKTDKTILEYVGVPGIGKTTLIKHMISYLDQRGIPYARLDFRDDCGHGDPSQYAIRPDKIFIDLLADLHCPVSPDLQTVLDALVTTLPSSEDFKKPAEDAVELFKSQILAIVNKPLVFLLDGTEKIDSLNLKWFEEIFVGTLASSGQCVIWSGRTKTTWRNSSGYYSWANLVQDHQRVRPFSKNDIEMVIRPQLVSVVSRTILDQLDQIIALTGGHPRAFSIAIDYLQRTNSPMSVLQQRTNIVSKIGRDWLDGFIRNDECACQYPLKFWLLLSIPRTMQLAPFLRGLDGGSGTWDFTVKADHPLKGYECDEDHKATCVASPFRELFLEYLPLSCLQLYISAQNIMLEKCKELANQEGNQKDSYWRFHVDHFLYHAACRNRYNPQPIDLNGLLTDLLIERQERCNSDIFLDDLHLLNDVLKNDYELASILGQEQLDQLVENILGIFPTP